MDNRLIYRVLLSLALVSLLIVFVTVLSYMYKLAEVRTAQDLALLYSNQIYVVITLALGIVVAGVSIMYSFMFRINTIDVDKLKSDINLKVEIPKKKIPKKKKKK